jgi:hypothetical protein
MALLPVLGIPGPLVADEFGYLLLADTFASGRIVNPTHPFWRHFETVYVFHQPGYTSIYPVAPAILLAIVKALGMHPWIGVWFGAGLMCATICWMLQGWVQPKWALIGGLLAVARFTIVSSWMNTYWGGATAAIGGALVLGALPRIMQHHRRFINTGISPMCFSGNWKRAGPGSPGPTRQFVWGVSGCSIFSPCSRFRFFCCRLYKVNGARWCLCCAGFRCWLAMPCILSSSRTTQLHFAGP